MRKACSVFMTLLLVLGVFASLGSPTRAMQTETSATSAISIPDESGQPATTVTVDSILDPYEGYDSSSGPQRGFRFVMLALTVTNVSDHPLDFSQYGLYLADQDGFLVSPTYVYGRTDGIPDLPYNTIDPGASISGAVFFEIFGSATISHVLYSPDSSRFYLLASDAPAPDAGEDVPLIGQEGGTLATVTVSDLVEPYSDPTMGTSPQRGYHYAAVTITITNTGSRPFSIDSYAYLMVDSQGFASWPVSVYRTTEPDIPDLGYGDIAPGDSLTARAIYEIFNQAEPAYFVYANPGTQMILLTAFDGATEPPAVSAIPVGTPTIPGTTTTTPAASLEETGDCVGVRDWMAWMDERIGTLDEFELELETVEDVQNADLAELNRFLSAAEDLAAEIRDHETPAVAEPLRDAYLDLLTLTIDTAGDLIDARTSGGDIQAILDGIDEKVDTVSGTMFTAFSDLQTACPASIS